MFNSFFSFIYGNWKWIISSILIIVGLIFSFYYKYKDNKNSGKSTKSEIWPFVISLIGIIFGCIVSYNDFVENGKAKIETDKAKQETKNFQNRTDSFTYRIDSLTNRTDSVTHKNMQLSEDIINISKDEVAKANYTLSLQTKLITSQQNLISLQNNSLAELKGSNDTPHLFINSLQIGDHNELMLKISNYDSITLRNVVIQYFDNPLFVYLMHNNERHDLSPDANRQRRFTIGSNDYDTMMVRMDYSHPQENEIRDYYFLVKWKNKEVGYEFHLSYVTGEGFMPETSKLLDKNQNIIRTLEMYGWL